MRCPEAASRRELARWTRLALRELGARPRRGLGQSFLVDPAPLRRYEELIPWGSRVYEPGPGLGVLTCLLSRLSSRVASVELDRRLAEWLVQLFDSRPNVLVIHADAVALSGLVAADVLASNLPYSAASQILVSAVQNNSIRLVVAMLQLEVARRITSRPGSRAYGRLSAVLRMYFSAEIDSIYPPSSFYPPPKVYSSLTVLRRVREWRDRDKCFLELARCLFTWPNRLASKAFRACGVQPPPGAEGVRVRQLPPSAIYEAAMSSPGCGGGS